MPIFIEMSKKNIIRLIDSLKEKLKVNNLDLVAEYLSISRPMLFNYLSKKYLVPEEIFRKLTEETGIKIDKYKEVRKEKFILKSIKSPVLNEDLAEILGALNGDGHVSSLNYEISITGSKYLDLEYFSHLKDILKKLFDLEFRISFQENRIKLRAYSKKLVYLLHKKYNLPLGEKLGKLKIPEKLKKDNLLTSYIRGLFDTDGTIYMRRKKEPVIEISSADKSYLKSVKSALESLNFKFGLGNNKIYLYNKKEIVRFFNLIKPANNKHLKKYQIYLNQSRASHIMV